MPHGQRSFEIEFDLIDHQLLITTSDRAVGRLALEPQTVAAFHARLMQELERLDLRVEIHKKPNEVAEAIPFDRDEVHRAYDAEYASRFGGVLVRADRVLKRFRGDFIGKCGPVRFFWCGPDLAVTRFAGRTALEHPGGVPNLPGHVAREAYSQEVSSCGFWAGGGPL